MAEPEHESGTASPDSSGNFMLSGVLDVFGYCPVDTLHSADNCSNEIGVFTTSTCPFEEQPASKNIETKKDIRIIESPKLSVITER